MMSMVEPTKEELLKKISTLEERIRSLETREEPGRITQLRSRLILRATKPGNYTPERVQEDFNYIIKTIADELKFTQAWLYSFYDNNSKPTTIGPGELPAGVSLLTTYGLPPEDSHLYGDSRRLQLSIDKVRGPLRYVINTHKAIKLRDAPEVWERIRSDPEYKKSFQPTAYSWEKTCLEREREDIPEGWTEEKWHEYIDEILTTLPKPPENSSEASVEDWETQRRRWWKQKNPMLGGSRRCRNFAHFMKIAAIPVALDDHLLAVLYLSGSEEGQEDKDISPDAFAFSQLFAQGLSEVIAFSTFADDLIRTKDQLADAKRVAALKGMTSQIAHDANNALQAALSHTNIALGNLTSDEVVRASRSDSSLRRKLRDTYLALTTAKNAQERVKDVIARSRGAVAVDAYRPIRKNLNEELSDYGLATEAPVHFTYDERVGETEFDPTLLYNAINNAVTNADRAIKLRREQDSSLEGRIEIATRRTNGDVEIIIEDNGIGMTEEELAKLNEDSFWTTKKGGEGVVGLGVSSMRTAVKAHGGTISYESKPLEGTKVIIRIPYKGTE